MTGSVRAKTGARDQQDEMPPAGSSKPLGWLKKRSEFLNCAKGLRVHAASFVLQCAPRQADPVDGTQRARFGLTVSKKNGNAIRRNRIKRRFRAVIAAAADGTAAKDVPGSGLDCETASASAGSAVLNVQTGCDYVIVAKPNALNDSFAALVEGLRRAVTKIHAAGPGSRGGHRRRSVARSIAAP